MIPIQFATDDEWTAEERRIAKPIEQARGTYETWERLHDSLVLVAEKFGTTSENQSSESPTRLPDFYHSGDWYDENWDRFDLLTSQGVSARSLRGLQHAVAAHGARSQLRL